jgi:GTP pyrophosphokinase
MVRASDFLTRIAQCCKPLPGDSIVGYITQGRGISIHKKNCNNIINHTQQEKFIEINWEEKNTDIFNTDLSIIAVDNNKILQELTALCSNEKVVLLRLNSNFNENQHKTFITATVQVQDKSHLDRLIHRIKQLPYVMDVERAK